VPNYHVLAATGPVHDEEVDELAQIGARIARRLGRELMGDEDAFTIILNGASASRRPWAHVHILPVRTPAEKRRAFAFLFLKGPLRRLERRLPLTR
jgi:diadenosine tetraphosphate (Ap4A) HIT family hydrolase